MANLLVSFILSICLYSQIGKSSKLKIIGGSPVTADQYPFIAWFHHEISGEYFSCGGSILRLKKPAVILTAAHCVYKYPTRQYITIGPETYVLLHADKKYDSNALKFPVNDYKVHPDYDGYTQNNDVALLFIDRDLTEYTELETAYFFDNLNEENECCKTGNDLTVIGYGDDWDGLPTATLEQVDVDYLSRSECQNGDFGRWPNGQIKDTMICAYTPGKSSCLGDSGGPLIIKGTSEQVGIVSFGSEGGCNDIPSVYTSIGHPDIYKWINDNAKLE